MAVAWYTRAHDSQRVRAAFSTDSGKSFTSARDVDELTGDRAPVGRVGVVLADDELPIARVAAGPAGGVPRMARAGSELVFVWTEPTVPSGLRGARVPLSSVPEIDR